MCKAGVIDEERERGGVEWKMTEMKFVCSKVELSVSPVCFCFMAASYTFYIWNYRCPNFALILFISEFFGFKKIFLQLNKYLKEILNIRVDYTYIGFLFFIF